ncbi:MAG: 4Fe-4S cluster-binding domain-containing protein [Candidatus Cryptobacteroides sp.]
MLKYADVKVVFREVPDEIALAINITNCPCHCRGCHSEYLADDFGTPLDAVSLDKLIDAHPGISCVSFMGGDAEPEAVCALAVQVREKGLKTCWYSGRPLPEDLSVLSCYDYVKTGPFIPECGPLDSPDTNQRFHKVIRNGGKSISLEDITYMFQR